MSKRTVLLDCDGVLANFIGPVCQLVAEVTGQVRRPEEVTRFDFAASLGLTPEQKYTVTQVISNQPGWWLSLPVLPGAKEGVSRLREVADVYIVTSPWNSRQTWLFEREHWLKKHFDIPHAHVLAGAAKHLVSGDIFVDDKTEACARWDEAQGSFYQRDGKTHETFAVQWITPHNRLDEWSGRSTNNWDQLVEWVLS